VTPFVAPVIVGFDFGLVDGLGVVGVAYWADAAERFSTFGG
jgi:hypothetical protein